MRSRADSHVHTRFSADGQDSMEDMCKSAVEKGLAYICFTDHIDNNPSDAGVGFFDFIKYSEEVDRLREKFADKIKILKGVEFSEPHLYPREFEKVLKQDFDMVMVGVHYLGPTYVGDKIHQPDMTKEKIFLEYFEEVLKTISYGGFDVLAHLDLPKRYIKDTAKDLELVTNNIINLLVEKGIAIEINTSPLRRGYHESAPGPDLLKRYLEAGGRNITTGSDAHRQSDVAADFDYAYELIGRYKANLGIFEQRKFKKVGSEQEKSLIKTGAGGLY